jgi:hypothetical protein
MKRITYSLIALFLLSAGLSIVSLSCNKEASAQPDTTISPLGIITYFKYINGTSEYWKCNYDGTGKTKINIPALPDNFELFGDFQVSPDGQKVFFTCSRHGTGPGGGQEIRLYRANIDGTGLLLIDGSASAGNINQAL